MHVKDRGSLKQVGGNEDTRLRLCWQIQDSWKSVDPGLVALAEALVSRNDIRSSNLHRK